jgi:hypothetical protein
MTSIKDIRAAIDAGLDRLQAKAEAVAAQLELSNRDINGRIAEHEKKLQDAAEVLQAKLADAGSVATENQAKIQSAFEHLQVQLALGAADSRDAFNAKKREIQHGIARFNAELDAAEAAEERERAAELKVLVEAYVAETIALEAELEAMDERYTSA